MALIVFTKFCTSYVWILKWNGYIEDIVWSWTQPSMIIWFTVSLPTRRWISMDEHIHFEAGYTALLDKPDPSPGPATCWAHILPVAEGSARHWSKWPAVALIATRNKLGPGVDAENFIQKKWCYEFAGPDWPFVLLWNWQQWSRFLQIEFA